MQEVAFLQKKNVTFTKGNKKNKIEEIIVVATLYMALKYLETGRFFGT
jgi:hypothetical protein